MKRIKINLEEYRVLNELVLDEGAATLGDEPQTADEHGGGLLANISYDPYNMSKGRVARIVSSLDSKSMIALKNNPNTGEKDAYNLTEKGLEAWRQYRHAFGFPLDHPPAFLCKKAPTEIQTPTKDKTPMKYKSEKQLKEMSTAEIVSLYNELADKPVKKFS